MLGHESVTKASRISEKSKPLDQFQNLFCKVRKEVKAIYLQTLLLYSNHSIDVFGQ